MSVYIFLAALSNLVIIFDTTMSEKNFGPAKSSTLKFIDKLRGSNLVIGNYILLAFDEGFTFLFHT